MNDGGPAFPVSWLDWHEQRVNCLSLRDYFAAKALQGWLATYANHPHPVDAGYSLTVAKHAYAMADAMLKEREK